MGDGEMLKQVERDRGDVEIVDEQAAKLSRSNKFGMTEKICSGMTEEKNRLYAPRRGRLRLDPLMR